MGIIPLSRDHVKKTGENPLWREMADRGKQASGAMVAGALKGTRDLVPALVPEMTIKEVTA